MDFDQALAYATFEIGIGQAQGHAQAVRHMALGNIAAVMNGLQQFQGQGVFFVAIVHFVNIIGQAVHKMNSLR